MNGLGDRDRSLSPEWDTLLGSITPDPQPPSVGSSFASASAWASAAATSSLGPESANTPMTSLGLSEDSPTLGDCISESEDEEDMYELQDPSRATRSERFWRTYADVVTPQAGDLGGMQRIISGLASREDIPDDWWAGAGLSRVGAGLRRDGST